MMLRLLLAALLLLPGLARAQEVISVFEVHNNTDATLRITAVREEHGDTISDIDVLPRGRRALRLPVGTWRITATPVRTRGIDPVERRFSLPDAGPYGIAFAAGDFGVARLEDGPWSALPPDQDNAAAAGLPPAVGRGIEAEYPVRRNICEPLTRPAVDPYYAFIGSNESCVRPWSNQGFHEGRRVCRLCPDGSDWDAARACCFVR